MDPTYDGSATLYSMPIAGLDDYRNSMTTLSKLIAEAGEDNTDNSLFTAEQQKAFWDAVNEGGVAFAQEIIDACVSNGYAEEGDVAAAASAWGFDGLALTLPQRISSWLSQKTMTGTLLPWKLRPQVLLCLT